MVKNEHFLGVLGTLVTYKKIPAQKDNMVR